MFSQVLGDQLQCSTQQSLSNPQPLLCLSDSRPKIFSPWRDSQRADFGELLSISLYVFGDDREGCRNRVVHGLSVARRATKWRLPRLRCCRYREQLCIR